MSGKIRVFFVDDEPHFRELVVKMLPPERFVVAAYATAAEVLMAMDEREFDVGVIDVQMPGMDGIALLREMKRINTLTEFIILTGQASVSSAIESMKLGCYDYLTKPLRMEELELVIARAYERKAINRENQALKKELQLGVRCHELVGKSAPMQHVFSLIAKVAPTVSPVLVTGESGTGKELVARAIHKSSPRKNQPFIVIDCASLSENLLENELFGHEEGAFTDASRMKPGLFEIADGGTLFIDEIGEMKLSTQAKLLRVTEAHQFRRLGGNRLIEVDVRIVAATNRDLGEAVANGAFRQDLYYRLNVFPVHLPPLRARKDDIPLLAQYFIATRCPGQSKHLSAAALGAMMAYNWPGNVRELANVIERALIISSGEQITPAELPAEFAKDIMAEVTGTPATGLAASLDELVREYERTIILKTLQECGGNRVEAARALKLSRSKLYRKMEQLVIPYRYRMNKADVFSSR